MTIKTIKHDLDYNCLFPIELQFDPDAHTLAVTIDRDGDMYRRLRGNLSNLLQCMPAQAGLTPLKRIEGDTVYFTHVPEDFRLSFAGKPFALYQNHEYNGLGVSELRPFTASALRTLGSQHPSKAAAYYLPDEFEKFEPLRQKASGTITTDFHTHSSGQISAEGLVKVALAHDALYPEHLLNDLGISPAKDIPRTKQKRIHFQPLEPQNLPDEVDCVALKSLTPEQLHVLQDALSLRTDRQWSYTDAENECYRLRYPFTKNNALIKDSLRQMARESMSNGIMHVEISFVGLDNPEIFRKVHEAIWEMEHDSEFAGFALRLKHGIPRTFTQDQIRESLEKAKILAQSPYVVGVDFLGYEINKTNSFHEELDEFAAWVAENDPDFTICVHAGENDKNPENVKEALHIVLKHGVRMRIGHGLYGLDDEAIEIIRATEKKWPQRIPLVHIEANPDSNIALNNINNLGDMPLRFMLDNNVPFVVSSDSLGLYRTSSEQLGLSLLHAGLSAKDLDVVANHQNGLRDKQHSYSHAKTAALNGWNTEEGRDAHLEETLSELAQVPKAVVPKRKHIEDSVIQQMLQGPSLIPESKDERSSQGPQVVVPSRRHREAMLENPAGIREKLENDPAAATLRDMLKERIPITVVGASGTSWKRVPPGHQREIAITLDMLTHVLDPEKAYFVQGRNKREGLCKQLKDTINRANKGAETRFVTAGLLTDPTPDTAIDHSHLDYVFRIDHPLNVADEIVDFTVRHNGALLAIGGSAFTRDIILKADRKMENTGKGALLLMKGPKGASTEKAAIMDDSYHFTDGKELIGKLQALMKERPEIFKPGYADLNTESIQTLYEQAAERVGQPAKRPAPTAQTVEDAKQLPLLFPQRGR